MQEQQSEELPPEAAGMPGVEEALPSAEQLPDMQMPEMEGVQDEAMPEAQEGQQQDGSMPEAEEGQRQDGSMPEAQESQQPYNSREEIGRRFRERAKPLVDQTRDLWQRIRQIEDPVTRTLKELAYEMQFRTMWEEEVNEQFYREYPHLRPDPEVENRKVQEKLAQKPPVLLQVAYDMVREQPWYGAGQQGYGNMPVVPTINQRNGEMNEAVNGDVYSPMHPANSGVAGENKNNYSILSTRAMVTPNEGEMKPLHEWVVGHSLYEGNPEVSKKDKLPALKNDETFQEAHLKAAETFEKRRENGIIELGKTSHASERMRERAVTDDDVHDTLTNPIHSKEIVTDNLGRKSQILIGKNATVCVNPDTGNVITAWKTGTKTRKKYTGGD